jgi:uncharacterized protein YjbI with pentapeptide repeats
MEENRTFAKENWNDLKGKGFAHCIFENCDLTKCNLTGAKFVDCVFKRCNLSLAKLDGCRLQGVAFYECKFMGTNFGVCDPLFLSLRFFHCLIDTCNFSDLSLKGTVFEHSHIRETHFTHANLTEANFAGSDLRGSIFHNTDLSHANFVGARDYAINPLTNQLKQARFSMPDVVTLLDSLGIIIVN